MLETALKHPLSNKTVVAFRHEQAEDRELLAIAAKLGREFAKPSPMIYWTDLACTAFVAYLALAATLVLPFGPVPIIAFGVSFLAFYRGLSFIHELTHLRRDAIPGFASVWNVLFGIPLLVPSFMYDDVHTVHHARTTYGTSKDPEYLPFASLPRRTAIAFLAAGAVIPVGLLLRFSVLGPLSLAMPKLRKAIVERCSSLSINPAFRRRSPARNALPQWYTLESAASAWAIIIVGLTATGIFELRSVATCFAVGIGVAMINQARTLVSHTWKNDRDGPLTLTTQYLDSVNVPPPAKLPLLWAPVGLRFHALHHLLPSVPYHALGKVHGLLTWQVGLKDGLLHPDYSGFSDVLNRGVLAGGVTCEGGQA